MIKKVYLCVIFLGVLAICAACVPSLESFPKKEQEFLLQPNELVEAYSGIEEFHPKNMDLSRGYKLDKLINDWGKPIVKNSWSTHLESTIATTLIIASIIPDEPDVVLLSGGLIFAMGYPASRISNVEELVWQKGDYEINAKVQRALGEKYLLAWKWKYIPTGANVPTKKRTGSRMYSAIRFGAGKKYTNNQDLNLGSGFRYQLGSLYVAKNFDFVSSISFRSSLARENRDDVSFSGLSVDGEILRPLGEKLKLGIGASYLLQGNLNTGFKEEVEPGFGLNGRILLRVSGKVYHYFFVEYFKSETVTGVEFDHSSMGFGFGF